MPMWVARLRSRRALVPVLVAGTLLAGCSGRTTGAVDITSLNTGLSARLTAVGSCDDSCTAFVRWRQVGQSAWTDAPSFHVGHAVDARWGQTVTGLTYGASYEYQACGKERTSSGFVCVGPNGSTNTTQRFLARAGAGDWPQFHANAALTGDNPFEVALSAGNVGTLARTWSWRSPSSGGAVGSPTVVNGVVYVTVSFAQGPSYLEAFRAYCGAGGASCAPIWRAPIANPPAGAAPAVSRGVVYVSGAKLYAFGADGCGSDSCAPIWTGPTVADLVTSPTVGDVVVDVGTGTADHTFYSFAAQGCGAATCNPYSTRNAAGAVATVAVAPTTTRGGPATVVAANRSVDVYAGSGDHVWTQLLGGALTAPTTASDQQIAIGSADGKLSSLYTVTGEVVWTGATGGPIRSAPAAAAGIVYVGSDDGKLYAFSATCQLLGRSCTPLWTGATGGPIRSAPAIAHGVVYVTSYDGKLYEFAAAGCGAAACAPLATQAPAGGVDPSSSPAVASGVVYVSTRPAAGGGPALQAYSTP